MFLIYKNILPIDPLSSGSLDFTVTTLNINHKSDK